MYLLRRFAAPLSASLAPRPAPRSSARLPAPPAARRPPLAGPSPPSPAPVPRTPPSAPAATRPEPAAVDRLDRLHVAAGDDGAARAGRLVDPRVVRPGDECRERDAHRPHQDRGNPHAATAALESLRCPARSALDRNAASTR